MTFVTLAAGGAAAVTVRAGAVAERVVTECVVAERVLAVRLRTARPAHSARP
ncbi:hypothetical protein [Streptomyces sp. NPDC048636]|uniref:hypothetical protein n=1 Tax=Streptomyces sp. NPDC048636 TaxID=3155762 RepID=UPI00341B39D6